MNPKYQIFISSTYEDLKEEREQVLKSILRLGHIPIGMELFNAANETQWQMIKRRIEESDYYVVIVAHRYGSIDKESGLSYTEKEYDYANELGVPTIAFVLDRAASWPGDRRDPEPKKQKALTKFIAKAQSKVRAPWSNKDNLATAVALALNEQISAIPRIGWVRANQAVSSDTVNEMTRLSRENAELREQLVQLQQAPRNVAPIPELDVDIYAATGERTWFDFEDSSNPPFGLPRVYSGHRFVEEVTLDGLWLIVQVSNSGTLATNMRVEISCSQPIVSQKSIDVFKKKMEFDIIKTYNAEGIYDAKVNEDDGSWTFTGRISGLSSGLEFTFAAIPLVGEVEEQFGEAVIDVDVFPVTGSHIHKCCTVRQLMNSER